VGVPENCGETVIVNVTALPIPEGFAEETTTAVVAALFTISVRAADELPVTFPSPLYTAVMECEPIDRLFTVRLAVFPLTAALPKDVLPSLKPTVPVATPPFTDEIMAVKVTDWL
jgi:hypothetical protein